MEDTIQVAPEEKTETETSSDGVDETGPTEKEVALENLLKESKNELESLKKQLREIKVRNEELAIKVGLNNTNTEELFTHFSKYYKER